MCVCQNKMNWKRWSWVLQLLLLLKSNFLVWWKFGKLCAWDLNSGVAFSHFHTLLNIFHTFTPCWISFTLSHFHTLTLSHFHTFLNIFQIFTLQYFPQYLSHFHTFLNFFQEPLDLADPKLVQAIWKPEVISFVENWIAERKKTIFHLKSFRYCHWSQLGWNLRLFCDCPLRFSSQMQRRATSSLWQCQIFSSGSILTGKSFTF